MDQSIRQIPDYLWLALILALALILRIIGLDAPLWYDEITTVNNHLRLPWVEMFDSYSMNNHYLFNLQSKMAIGAFGEQNWVIRLPAMLFGVGSVAAMWWLARDVAGPAIAHLTALLLALSYHHIWFSQNARGYSELAFFGTIGMVLFLRGIGRPTIGIWLAYGITLALAVFTHLTGAFLFAAQGLVWLALVAVNAAKGTLKSGQVRPPILGYFVGGALTLLLYAPLLPSLIDTVAGVSSTSDIDVMQEYQNPIWSLLEGVRTALGSTGNLVTAVAALVLSLALIGSVAAHRLSRLYAPLVWLHIGTTLVLLVALGMRIWPRFFFADIGFVLLLIVLGVRAVVDRFDTLTNKLIPKSFAIAAAAMILVSAGLASRNYAAPKQNLIGAYSFVQDTRAPDQQVFTVGVASPVFTEYFDAGWKTIQTDSEYETAREAGDDALFVVAFPSRSLRRVATLDADIGTRVELVKRFPGTLGDGAVLILRQKP